MLPLRLLLPKTLICPPASESSMQGTFFHELVHAILEEIGEYKLTGNERFVQSFSTILNHVTQQLIDENR